MGSSGAAYYPKPFNQNLALLNQYQCLKLLAFSIKTYDVQGQYSDHTQIEALVENQNGYFVIRFSYGANGLTVHQLLRPRSTPYKKHKSYKCLSCWQYTAWSLLVEIAKKYNRQQYSFCNTNCQSFTDEVIEELSCLSNRIYLTVWQEYSYL